MTVDGRDIDEVDGDGAIDVVDDPHHPHDPHEAVDGIDDGVVDVLDGEGHALDDPDLIDGGYAPDEVFDERSTSGGAARPGAMIAVATAHQRRVPWRHALGSVLLARIGTALLWLLIVGAVVLAVLALLVRTTPSAPADADARAGTGARVSGADAARVAGFAQLAVRRFVGEAGEGTEEVMDGLVAGDMPPLDGVTPGGFYVVDAVTVDVDDLGGGYWSATVALDLMAAIDQRYGPVGVRYYSVGVATGDGGPVLTDLPSMVPAPAAAEPPELAASSLESPDRDSPQVATVREFLGALLLGEGSIQRYLAPGTQIAAITPPPFRELEVEEVAIVDPEADETAVRVSVHALDEHGLAQRLHYALDLQVREDRWEVVALDGAPPLAPEEGSRR